jgi:hypothetical protein
MVKSRGIIQHFNIFHFRNLYYIGRKSYGKFFIEETWVWNGGMTGEPENKGIR